MNLINELRFRKSLNICENDFSVEEDEYSPEQGYLFMLQQQQRLLDKFSAKR